MLFFVSVFSYLELVCLFVVFWCIFTFVLSYLSSLVLVLAWKNFHTCKTVLTHSLPTQRPPSAYAAASASCPLALLSGFGYHLCFFPGASLLASVSSGM